MLFIEPCVWDITNEQFGNWLSMVDMDISWQKHDSLFFLLCVMLIYLNNWIFLEGPLSSWSQIIYGSVDNAFTIQWCPTAKVKIFAFSSAHVSDFPFQLCLVYLLLPFSHFSVAICRRYEATLMSCLLFDPFLKVFLFYYISCYHLSSLRALS